MRDENAPFVTAITIMVRRQTVVIDRQGHNLRITGLPALLIVLAVFGIITIFIVRFFRLRRNARIASERHDAMEAELRAVFAAMEDVVLVLDRNGDYLRKPTTNARGRHRSSSDLRERNIEDVFPADAGRRARAAIAQAIDTGQTAAIEYKVDSGAEATWFAATISPFDTHSVVWVARDITAQKAARDAVAQSEARYRLLFERNPCAMWVFDYDTTRILEVNDAAVSQYGYTREEFTRLTLRDLRSPEEAERLDSMLRDLAPDGESVHVARHLTKDGAAIDVEVRGHPLLSPGRQLRLVVSTDVTERLSAERAVRDAESRAIATSQMLQSIVDAAPQAIIVVDLDWRVTRWNRAAEALFGWSQEEVLGRNAPFIAEEEKDDAAARQRLADQRPTGRQFEAVRVCKDGRRVDVLVANAPLEDAVGTRIGYVAVYADLTERKALGEQLRQAQKMEAIGTLAGGVAHDFNNILTVIASYSSMLLSDNEYPKIRSDLEEISAAARRATGVTRQLLTFSRKAIVHLRPIDLNAIVNEMKPMLRRLLMAHIELVTKCDDRVGQVIADPTQIEQILMNLVGNASDAMPDGGTLVIETRNVELDEEYTQTHAGVRPGTYVLLAATDTGIGMDAATARKIFEPFFTTKPVGRGTGLGLATVYAIVKQLGGHIWVYSEPGHGAAFKIYLPHDASTLLVEDASVAAGSMHRTGTALLVEDDEVVRRVTRRVLEDIGFRVLEAPDGEAALTVARNYAGDIEVVVTDIMMPKMNGGDFAQALATTHPELRVVFTSGYTDEAVLRRGLVNTAHTFLQKPFTSEQLAQAISALLDGDDEG